jgi:hypothetical protein
MGLYDFRLYCDSRHLSIASAQTSRSPLLDSATVFQTAMVRNVLYHADDKESVMWQLSFPMLRERRFECSRPKYLKQEAIRRTNGTSVPEKFYMHSRRERSGYPVLSEILSAFNLKRDSTLMGVQRIL